MAAYKKIIDGLVFVYDRRIPLVLPETWRSHEFLQESVGFDLPICERPLRASTAQGDRVCIARSEAAPEGTQVTFQVKCVDPRHAKAVIEWLDYGMLKGLSQWRNGGFGRFTYEILDDVAVADAA